MKTLSRVIISFNLACKPELIVRRNHASLITCRRKYSDRVAAENEVTRVLVTGASGYIASSIVDSLLARGYNVRGTVRSLKNPNRVAPLTSLADGKPGALELVEADLLDPGSWKSAVTDCSHVLHTASPFPMAQPKNADEVVRPAVEGTLSVLRACRDAGTVRRVVMTSSVASVGLYDAGRPLTEEDWMDPSRGGAEAEPYTVSKLMAEKEAYKFVNDLSEEEKFELCSILPALVVGPSKTNQAATSLDLIKRMMTGGDPLAPVLGLKLVDVRDVADAHIICMTSAKAAGERFIIGDLDISFVDLCKLLYDEFHEQGYSPPTRLAPRILMRLAALFDDEARFTNLLWGLPNALDNSKMKNILGITPRDSRKSVIEMVYSLIEGGYIEKRPKYKGRNK